MVDAFFQGAANIVRPEFLAVIAVGTLIGVIAGVLPTITGMVAAALLLPFVLGMPKEIAVLLLIGVLSTQETGGSITSILLNVPGTGLNAATLLDGFPMNQRGEGARAIGAALTSSVFGGVIAVGMALLMLPVVIPAVLAFHTGDMVLLILLGLCLLAIIVRGSAIKGMIAGLLGVMVAAIGFYVETGTDRFTWGSTYLYEGLGIIPVTVGLFGVSTLLGLLIEGMPTIARGPERTSIKAILVGAKDVWHHRWLWLRSTIIGYVVGVLPGAGGSVATFTAYAHAKQTSKHPELFGTGNVEGVIAPESANNAKDAGALLTTLVFGIPGSAQMVIIIAALYAVGVFPGPLMVTQQLDLTFTLLIGIAVANIIAVIYCLGAAPYLAKLAHTPMDFLFPVVLVLVFVGTFADQTTMTGVVTALIFGLLGLLMIMLEYNRAAFILGFVLGSLFEHNLWLALKLQGPLFFMSPISIALILIIILMFTLPLLRKAFTRHKGVKKV